VKQLPRADLLIYNISEGLPIASKAVGSREVEKTVAYGLGIAVRDRKIIEVGRSKAIKDKYDAKIKVNAGGRLLTPGLIDMHTHAIFFGSRDEEFVKKISGIPYEKILKEGGGIYKTVEATNNASDKDLLASLLKRLNTMLGLGTTSVEIKSGYGIEPDKEVRLLKVIKEASKVTAVTVVPTLLAHVPPKGSDGDDRIQYINSFSSELLPEVKKENLASFVDVFCDEGAFNPEEADTIFSMAASLGLGMRAHIDQLKNIGCSKLLQKFKLSSVDHLEVSDENSIINIASSNAIAGLLPASFLATQSKSKPPIDLIRKYNIPIAIGTDFSANSLMPSMQNAIDLAIYLYSLTPLEALVASTLNAAESLKLSNRGRILEGCYADLIIWDLERSSMFGYDWGRNRILVLIKDGSIIVNKI